MMQLYQILLWLYLRIQVGTKLIVVKRIKYFGEKIKSVIFFMKIVKHQINISENLVEKIRKILIAHLIMQVLENLLLKHFLIIVNIINFLPVKLMIQTENAKIQLV